MPPDVIQKFQAGAVFVLHPREERVQRVALDFGEGELRAVERARFGKSFRRRRGESVVRGRLVEIIERAVGAVAEAVVGGRAVLHQMIPAREEESSKAVNERMKIAARRMIELEQIRVRRVQAPQAGVRGEAVVFVQLRIQMRRAVARAVAGEDDPLIRAVTGHDVVVVRRLTGNFGDDGRRTLRDEVCDLVKLPEEFRRVG